MDITVILSTYNAPDRLEKALWGYSLQTHRQFEVVIADDGSTSETRDLIRHMQEKTGMSIRHVWQEDDGFQKSRILNKATIRSAFPYLVYSDGDCIPRPDFLAVHARFAEPGFFLSGGYFKLPPELSQAITREDVIDGLVFSGRWLREQGMSWNRRFLKLWAARRWANLLNRLTTTGATWNGHNASGWMSDILAVNGFDERMQYGGQDRELGERLLNLGVRSKQIRYSAICVHLDHSRGYATPESRRTNEEIRRRTRREHVTWTDHGIEKKSAGGPVPIPVEEEGSAPTVGLHRSSSKRSDERGGRA